MPFWRRWWSLLLLFPLHVLLCGVCNRYDPVTFIFYGGIFPMAGLLYFPVGVLIRRFGVPWGDGLRKWWLWLPLATMVGVRGVPGISAPSFQCSYSGDDVF